jgi:hypothetical protein
MSIPTWRPGMLAQFDGFHHDSHFGFAAPVAAKSSAPVAAGAVRSTAGDPLGVARLGDLLPQVLERYGYAPAAEVQSERRRPETNRPGVARMRRRVG